MKPGMQRDILVAFWFLFDEFEIGDGDGSGSTPSDPTPSAPPRGPAAPAEAALSEKSNPAKRPG